MSNFKLTNRFFTSALFVLLLSSCSNNKQIAITPAIIPAPLSQQINKGAFVIDNSTGIYSEAEEFTPVADFLKTFIEYGSDLELSTLDFKKVIYFKKDVTIKNPEGYKLKVSNKEILISASSPKGAFYAVQSLRQLLPASFENNTYKEKTVAVQNLEIYDEPQFKYRGMHLDVGRHFFPVEFIKKYIDLMSMLKMNTFHWHLTEDQGWRIEIKKYPKLNEIAAYRKETLIGHYSDQPHQFDGKKYGGFYTQEQIKDIVKYATKRQVTIIPEIEMPGHSQAALSAYPELGCTGKPIDVATKWGVFDDIYCSKESTFKFLEDVLDEVMALFPGKYIHIGGDEAPKTRWKSCKHCQQLIKSKNLKDEHGLQSYFIARMEKYINSKGKQIIGWDEILEGGLAPNATVMSWRGTNGAVEAAKQKHPVILTPQSHCYFDHYQSENENEPLAIGGFLPLEKVYLFNPIPKELTTEEARYVLGAQGNVWTEYLSTPEKVEYMVFPRAIALSEAVWSSSVHKNYNDFINRLEIFNKRLDAMNVNYANHLYEINGELLNDNGKLSYKLETITNKKIVYTLNGKEPINLLHQEYDEPIKIDSSATIKAVIFNTDGEQLGTIFEQRINLHKAVGKQISLNILPNEAYNSGGKQALINGVSGNNKRYGDKEWLGFSGDDVEIIIAFDTPTEINKISTRFYNGNGQWIYAPKEINIQLDLENGKIAFFKNKLTKNDSILVNFSFIFTKLNPKKEKINSIKLTIPNYGIIPEGKQGAGHKAWTFIDEIIIE